MSQAGVNNTSISPPAVPLQFTTDVNSPAIAVANNLNILGDETSDYNISGIQTDGGSGSDTVTVQLTNRISGGGSTTDGSTFDAVTFTLPASEGVYVFEILVAAYDQTTPSGGGWSLFGAVFTDGVTATLCDTVDKVVNAQVALNDADATLSTSGNDVIVQVTGVVGLDITWSAYGTYNRGV